jgi:hypothetical protein
MEAEGVVAALVRAEVMAVVAGATQTAGEGLAKVETAQVLAPDGGEGVVETIVLPMAGLHHAAAYVLGRSVSRRRGPVRTTGNDDGGPGALERRKGTEGGKEDGGETQREKGEAQK